METPEAQEEYKKRSHTVEPPFGVLKQQKQLNTARSKNRPLKSYI